MIKKEIDFKDKITIDDLNENQYRVRRNLLIFSTIGVFYQIYSDKYEIKIKQIFGIIEFKDPLNPDILEIGLFFLILYFFIHWTLIVWQHLKFMRIRVTQNDGGRPMPGTWGDENFEKDYPKNPTESNLHYWFNKHFKELNKTSKEIINSKNTFCDEANKINRFFDEYASGDQIKINSDPVAHFHNSGSKIAILESLKIIKESLENLHSGQIGKINNQNRLLKSLNNFDNWFNCYNKIELARFIIIIHSFPLFLGLLSIFFLII